MSEVTLRNGHRVTAQELAMTHMTLETLRDEQGEQLLGRLWMFALYHAGPTAEEKAILARYNLIEEDFTIRADTAKIIEALYDGSGIRPVAQALQRPESEFACEL